MFVAHSLPNESCACRHEIQRRTQTLGNGRRILKAVRQVFPYHHRGLERAGESKELVERRSHLRWLLDMAEDIGHSHLCVDWWSGRCAAACFPLMLATIPEAT